MKTTSSNRTSSRLIWNGGPDPDSLRPPSVLEDLVSGGALTDFQTRWLAERWDELPNDWSRHPFCRQIGEHTRTFIDRLRSETQPSATLRPLQSAVQ